MTFTVEVKGLDTFQNAGPEVDKALRAIVYSAGTLVHAEIVQRTPADLGALRASIHLEVSGFLDTLSARITTGMNYADVVERGRQPNRKPPPIAAILPWVQRNIPGVEDPRAAAFLIARSIGRKGTEGAHMFEEGAKASQARVKALFERGAAALTRTLNK
jgi:hypothetical protein